MRIKILKIILIIGIIIFSFEISSALTTEELLRLKKSGVSEDIIVFMAENDYKEVDKIAKLKEAGFKDENILAIIKSELKEKISGTMTESESLKETRDEMSSFATTARIKILWYLIYRGEPVLQNSEVIDNARISIAHNTVKFEWEEKGGLGLLDFIRKKPFKSPFYWTISKDDNLAAGSEGYPFRLKSTASHKGAPETDGSHYWVIYLEPKNSKIIDHIKSFI